ncbi:MAG TPA: MoaD/ThiS family protein [Vicinamibacterales bacterium]
MTVKLFARLRDLAGAGDLETEVAQGSTIADVWSAVIARHPALAPYGQSLSAARNLEYARMNSPVQDGDEIAFMPPVSGG